MRQYEDLETSGIEVYIYRQDTFAVHISRNSLMDDHEILERIRELESRVKKL